MNQNQIWMMEIIIDIKLRVICSYNESCVANLSMAVIVSRDCLFHLITDYETFRGLLQLLEKNNQILPSFFMYMSNFSQFKLKV